MISSFIYGYKAYVETDHKPLVAITKRSVHTALKRLQRILLRLQKYGIELIYKRGEEMHIADALSRAYPKNSTSKVDEQSEFCHQVEDLILTEHLPISIDSLKQFSEETAMIKVCKYYCKWCLLGDLNKSKQEVQAYFPSRDEL